MEEEEEVEKKKEAFEDRVKRCIYQQSSITTIRGSLLEILHSSVTEGTFSRLETRPLLGCDSDSEQEKGLL